MNDQEKHQYCTNQFIELANRLKDEKFDPSLVSGALMTASGIYATYLAAGNEGALEPSGVKKVVDVYRREDIFRGPQLPKAPDLFVGFDSGYRVSWQTAAGGIPPATFEDNLNNWSGDHCSVSPDLTAGIFFSNRALPDAERSIMDFGPTALSALGVEVPQGLEGRPMQESR